MSEKKTSVKKKTSDKEKTELLQKKIQKLEEEIQKLQEELKEKKNKLLRAYADFQNYQKRMEKELHNMEEETKKKYLSELIDLHEILQKAYEDKNPKEGLKIILKNLNNLLERENIKSIECIGKPFDHNIHHAISTIEKNDCREGIIVEEVKKGYMIGDKLLRPSQVIVCQKKKKTKPN